MRPFQSWRVDCISGASSYVAVLKIPVSYFLLLLVGWDWVHLVLRPLLVYCTSPWLMMMIVEQLEEWRLAGETEELRENLPKRQFVDHKSHITRPGLEPEPRWEASD
jgi:hypothetical protein